MKQPTVQAEGQGCAQGCMIFIVISLIGAVIAGIIMPKAPSQPSKAKLEKEEKAKEWLSDPGNRKFFKEWSREQRNGQTNN